MTMKTLTREEIVERLKDRKLRVISDRTGIPYQTIRYIANDRGNSIHSGNQKLLSDYLQDKLDY